MTDPQTPGILARCDNGHEQLLLTPVYDRARAAVLAGLLDGTSPLYAAPPRTHPFPGSVVGRCGICGGWLTCTLVGCQQLRPEGRSLREGENQSPTIDASAD